MEPHPSPPHLPSPHAFVREAATATRDPAAQRRSSFGAGPPAPGRPSGAEPPSPPREPEPPLPWAAASGSGFIVGVAIIVVLLLVDLLAVRRLPDAHGGGRLLWGALALLVAIGVVGVVYLLRALSGLRYVFGRAGLSVEYLGSGRTIPYADVVDIVYKPHERVPSPGWERYWPGFHVSTLRMIDGVWHSWATLPPQRRVRIVTPTDVVAISPRRPIMFIEELDRRCGWTGEPAAAEAPARPRPEPAVSAVPPGPTGTPSRTRQLPGLAYTWQVLFRERLLGDPLASTLIAAGVVIPLLMIGYLYSQYEGIPSTIILHTNAAGEADSLGKPRDIWLLPVLAIVLLALNTALATFAEAFDRFVSRLILVSTPAIQALAFVAMLRLMNSG